MNQLPGRREALLSYFNAVVRDLLARGVIRYQRGEGFHDILRREFQTILQEVSTDFGAVMREVGFGLLNGITSIAGALLAGTRRR